jgi:DNA polymerase/3'-5' exonuclease PolX
MDLQQARALADELAEALSPGCERVSVAGSVRRGKPEVHDLEIVAIPRSEFVATGNLFGEMSELEIDHFGPTLREVLDSGRWMFDHVLKRNGPRYKRLRDERTGVCCDLFLATPAGWGGALAIRTGPSDFSQALVTLALRQGKHVADGYLIHGHPKPDRGCPAGAACPLIVPTPEETDFLSALGLPFLAPEHRTIEAIRHASRSVGGLQRRCIVD